MWFAWMTIRRLNILLHCLVTIHTILVGFFSAVFWLRKLSEFHSVPEEFSATESFKILKKCTNSEFKILKKRTNLLK